MAWRLGRFLVAAEKRLLRFPKTLVLLVLVLCGFSLYYTGHNLAIDTDTTKILSQKLPFIQDRERFLETFPQENETILVVVDAELPERATRAVDYLGEKFRSEAPNIQSVYIPGEGEFFDRHGLLYLDLDELYELTDTLAEAQPFVGTLTDDNTLKGLLSIIELAITTEERELPVDLNPLLEKIDEAVKATLNGENYLLSWQQLMFGDDGEMLTTQRFILLKPELDFTSLVPAETALKNVRTIVEEAKQRFPDVRIRLTGEVVLEHDELISVERSSEIASLLSLALVCLSLWIGLKSLRLVLITLTVLVTGLVLTAGFATVTIGHLNLISISFAVLYIGIGVDYAIQIALRYRELLQRDLPQHEALLEAVRKVAPSIALCAITTAAGFFSFVPTAYTGVSELGVIAGGGMLIALAVSLSVLPALLTQFPLDPAKAKARQKHFPQWVYRFPVRHRLAIKWGALVLTLAGAALLTQVRFDFNPLNLRDPESESLSTFRDLLKTKQTSPLTLTVLAESKEKTLAVAENLTKLKSVESAITIFDFVPDHQEEKITLLQDLSLILGLHRDTFPPVQEDSLKSHWQALESFLEAIDQSLTARPNSPIAESLRTLREDLQRLMGRLAEMPETKRKAILDKLQMSLLDTLPASMDRMLKSLQAGTVTLDILPEDLSERWLSPKGIYRIQAFPRKDLNDHENLKEFIADVRSVAPHATDLPVIYLESGNAIVKAFRQALAGALAAITLVLVIVHRGIRDPILILLPLLMTAILTSASTVVLDNPFNYANIIVIPLLLGLGVDSGIYIMLRLRTMPGEEEAILKTSTARGVIFASLTTLCSFVSMAFTPHLGLASIGLLLSIGLVLIILTSMLVLPALASKPTKPRP